MGRRCTLYAQPDSQLSERQERRKKQETNLIHFSVSCQSTIAVPSRHGQHYNSSFKLLIASLSNDDEVHG